MLSPPMLRLVHTYIAYFASDTPYSFSLSSSSSSFSSATRTIKTTTTTTAPAAEVTTTVVIAVVSSLSYIADLTTFSSCN